MKICRSIHYFFKTIKITNDCAVLDTLPQIEILRVVQTFRNEDKSTLLVEDELLCHIVVNFKNLTELILCLPPIQLVDNVQESSFLPNLTRFRLESYHTPPSLLEKLPTDIKQLTLKDGLMEQGNCDMHIRLLKNLSRFQNSHEICLIIRKRWQDSFNIPEEIYSTLLDVLSSMKSLREVTLRFEGWPETEKDKEWARKLVTCQRSIRPFSIKLQRFSYQNII